MRHHYLAPHHVAVLFEAELLLVDGLDAQAHSDGTCRPGAVALLDHPYMRASTVNGLFDRDDLADRMNQSGFAEVAGEALESPVVSDESLRSVVAAFVQSSATSKRKSLHSLARHPNTPPDALAMIAEHTDEPLALEFLSQNPRTPEASLATLGDRLEQILEKNDYDPPVIAHFRAVREAAVKAERESRTERRTWHDGWLDQPRATLRDAGAVAVAARRDTPVAVLNQIAREVVPALRGAAPVASACFHLAANPNTPGTALRAALRAIPAKHFMLQRGGAGPVYELDIAREAVAFGLFESAAARLATECGRAAGCACWPSRASPDAA